MMSVMIALTVAGFAAAVTTATVGVGGGLLVMPILSLIFPPRMVVATTTPMFWANAIVAFYLYRKHFWSARVRMVIPGAIVGILFGTFFVKDANPVVLRWVIGAVALAFLALSVMRGAKGGSPLPSLPNWLGIPISLVAGGVSSLSNIGGTLLSVYVLEEGMAPGLFVGGIAFLLLVMTSVKMAMFGAMGLLTLKELWWSLPSAGSITLGALWGRRINQKMSVNHFRYLIMGVVGVSSVLLLVSRSLLP